MSDRGHGCGFTWCTSQAGWCSYEHIGDSEIEIGDHSRDVEAVAAFAFVTAEPGKVYDDEIVLAIYGKDRAELAAVPITDHEAAQIQDMLGAAIAHRAEVRGTQPAGGAR